MAKPKFQYVAADPWKDLLRFSEIRREEHEFFRNSIEESKQEWREYNGADRQPFKIWLVIDNKPMWPVYEES